MAKKKQPKQAALFSDQERNIHSIEGVVDRVFFSNERFSAGTLETKSHGSIRIRGNMPLISPGMKLKGKWSLENDPKWGEQYEAVTVYVAEDVDELGGLEVYLRQKIKGIGPKAAAAIIAKFGDKTLEALTDPEKLAKVRGIGPALARAIPELWEQEQDEYMHLRNLFQLGLPYYQAKLAMQHFGSSAHTVLTGNIYRLTDVPGIGFKFADRIALDAGMEPLDPRRLAAVAAFAMGEALGDGHTIADEAMLLKYVDEKTDLGHEEALEGLRLALEAGEITHSYRGHYALTYVAEAEMEVMKRLHTLATSEGSVELEPADEFLTDEQREIFSILGRNRLAVLTGGPGVGKGLPLDAKVLTPRGWKRNGDLRLGDCLIGRDGKPTRVTGIYPQEVRPTFLVEFADGGSVICDDQHLWFTRTRQEQRRKSPGSVKGTLEIMDSLLVWNDRLNHAIDYVNPVHFNHPGPRCAEPYALGELLAREVTTPEEAAVLRSAGIHNTDPAHRRIPKEYLYAPIEDRVALLQGLMDSKATFLATGVLRWCCASSGLSRDFAELIQGLGGRVTTEAIRPTPDGDVYAHGFSFPESAGIEPFRHSPIREKYKPVTKPFHRFIVNITPVGEERTQCISVDAPDELFVTKDYVVTHNTRTVSALVDAAKRANIRFSLAAPTGKAARRMSELSGEGASTIHRLLMWQPPGGFFYNERNPLTEDLVIADECFDYKQIILTENGWDYIGQVVNDRKQIRVWSRNPETGELELKPIIRWLKKPYGKRLIKINASRSDSKRGMRQIHCTPEHKILTPSGYRKAGDLRVGDEVIVNAPGLTPRQRSILIGSLIGDGGLANASVRSSPQMTITCSTKDAEYIKYKQTILGELASHLRVVKSGYGGADVYQMHVRVVDEMYAWRDLFYTDGKRDPSQEFFDLIDDEALAIWFLDDGSLATLDTNGGTSYYATLHTEGLSPESLALARAHLLKRFGLKTTPVKARVGYTLNFGKQATERLLSIIRPFSPACMDRKVPGGYAESAPEVATSTSVAKVRSISEGGKRRFVYDIEVADFHNYVAGNIVVSNCSMTDVFLMRSLLRAIGPGTTLLLVGDADQLPPVGPGQPFAHIKTNVVRLTRIFRQAQENPIIMAAHAINNQKQPYFPEGDPRLAFESHTEPEPLIEAILRHYDELSEIHGEPPQILSPMNVGAIGVKALNARLKQHANPGVGEPFPLPGNQEVHVGDVVIQTKNDYEAGLMNGEQGTVLSYTDKEITLRTSLGDIVLTKGQAKTLQLAYAITIHRAQGSQWKSCIMLCHTSHFVMLSKELMYTGLTRASEAALIIGKRQALAMSLQRRMSERKSIMAFPEAWEDISGE